jgi:8-oxo-dGTP diphosphatase
VSEFPLGWKRAAVICIVRHRGAFLMLLREREPNRGLYVPVGGKLDAHESPQAAAIREIREEAGIEVDAVRLAGVLVETSPTKYNWWSSVYVSDLPEDAARPEVPQCPEGELGWFSRDELRALPMPATDRFIYEYVDRGETFAFAGDYDAELNLLRLEEEFSGNVLASRT